MLFGVIIIFAVSCVFYILLFFIGVKTLRAFDVLI